MWFLVDRRADAADVDAIASGSQHVTVALHGSAARRQFLDELGYGVAKVPRQSVQAGRAQRRRRTW
jgi:hypothetical protein